MHSRRIESLRKVEKSGVELSSIRSHLIVYLSRECISIEINRTSTLNVRDNREMIVSCRRIVSRGETVASQKSRNESQDGRVKGVVCHESV